MNARRAVASRSLVLAGRRPTRCGALLAAAICALHAHGVAAETRSGAEAAPDIAELLDVQPLPPIVVDPTARYAVLVHERQLLSLDRLSEPAAELAGHAVSLLNGGAHAPLDYYGLTLIDLRTGEQRPLAVPHDVVVGYPKWNSDGSRLAFTVTRRSGAELWVWEAATGQARSVARAVDTVRGPPCSWLRDNRRLLCRVSSERDGGRGTLRSIADRMAADALRGEPTTMTESQATGLLETQLEIVDCQSNGRHLIGAPAAFESVLAAPAQAFILVTRLVKPYPVGGEVGTAPRVTEVWDRFGHVIARLPGNARALDWQATTAATLTWVERRDDVDRVMSLAAPFSGAARERFALPHRFAGLRWLGDSSAALVSDYDPDKSTTSLWYVDFDAATTSPRNVADFEAERQLAVVGTNSWGFTTAVVHDNAFYIRGTTVQNEQRHNFLDRVALKTGARHRVWTAPDRGNESIEAVLDPDASTLLVRRDTIKAGPNYFLSSPDDDAELALTHFTRPSQLLTKARRIPLEYRRSDGVHLTASLYLPPNYGGHSALPLIFWAYPRQVSLSESTTQVSAEEDSSMTLSRAFHLFFLLRGYAVLDDVSMPIVGDESDANDTFVEQVVANAQAAIQAAGSTGFIDTRRIGVAGHSYGAFMVANLLVHSRLFSAGVALSGAYNRTLTPFGFQTERRTLWQAQKTYLAMSPLLFSDRIEAPLLLVHGLKDTNAGTSPQQSMQFYQAIRGTGGQAELLLLPWEGHSYRGRDSVLRTADHMLSWFDQHLKPSG